MNDLFKREIDLIDCYRLAVDFGKPAAEKAIEVINESLEKMEPVPATGESNDLLEPDDLTQRHILVF